MKNLINKEVSDCNLGQTAKKQLSLALLVKGVSKYRSFGKKKILALK